MTDSKVANTVHTKHRLYQGGGTVLASCTIHNYIRESVNSLCIVGMARTCNIIMYNRILIETVYEPIPGLISCAQLGCMLGKCAANPGFI